MKILTTCVSVTTCLLYICLGSGIARPEAKKVVFPLTPKQLQYNEENRASLVFMDKILKRLLVNNYITDNYYKIFAKEYVLSSVMTKDGKVSQSLASWKEYYRLVANRFQIYKDKLSNTWGLKGDILKVVFFMNIANNCWAFGRTSPKDPLPGCADSYLSTVNKINRKDVYRPSNYLNAPRGCCDDFAKILGILLYYSGIKFSFVGYPGYMYIEASVDNKLHIFDPMYNFWIPMSNHAFLEFSSKVVFNKFPTLSSNPANKKMYRERAGIRNIAAMFVFNKKRIIYYNHMEELLKIIQTY